VSVFILALSNRPANRIFFCTLLYCHLWPVCIYNNSHIVS